MYSLINTFEYFQFFGKAIGYNQKITMLKTIKQFYISRKSSIFASRKHKGKHIVEQFKKNKKK